MKTILPLSLATSILVVGCASQHNENANVSLDALLQNPLYAERYMENMVDFYTEFEIQEDPILDNEEINAFMDSERRNWLDQSRKVRELQREGFLGNLITVNKSVYGEVLYLNDMLYLGSEFESTPGPSLHLYLTQAVDPRDVAFPDSTSIDIGRLESAYGAQSYSVPPTDKPELYRTLVLWDDKLSILYGFAQLQEG